MEIIRMLSDPSAWQRFFEHKCAGGHLSRQQEEDLREFIDSQQYLQPVQWIQAGSNFAPPLSFYLGRYDEYLTAMEKLCLTDRI